MKSVSIHRVVILLAAFLLGCSSMHQPANPILTDVDENHHGAINGLQLWGLYDVAIDADSGDIEIVPLRSAEIELNVLRFLEPGGQVTGISIRNLELDFPLVSCDVGLHHPFPSFPEYAGFMVRGIVLTDGSMSGFENPVITLSAPDEVRLLNADGYTRWMNPVEFPYNGTILNYWQGIMGDPDGENYLSTVNPYKLFADGLSVNPDNLDLNEDDFAIFREGSSISRRYEFDFGAETSLRFQYAIVASHEMPVTYPPEGPEDWPGGTVANEPWRVEAFEVENDLNYYDGEQTGGLILQVRVRDFENVEEDTVFIEAPGIFPMQEMPLISQSGNHLTFEMEVQDIILTSADPFEALIAAVAEDGEGFDGRLPGEELATYILHEVTVTNEEPPPPDWIFYDDFVNYDHIWTAYGGDWWGKSDGYMDASGGGSCYEEDTGSDEENPNISYVSSPGIEIPLSDSDVLITINHMIDVDVPEPLGNFAWDMCYVRIDGEQIYPTEGPPYENNYYPWTFDPMPCWTSEYAMTESVFNIGADYNGTTIQIEFVLDTYDYIDNCDPPYFGWLIDDVLVDFDD